MAMNTIWYLILLLCLITPDDLNADPPTLPPLLAAKASYGVNNVAMITEATISINIDFYLISEKTF